MSFFNRIKAKFTLRTCASILASVIVSSIFRYYFFKYFPDISYKDLELLLPSSLVSILSYLITQVFLEHINFAGEGPIKIDFGKFFMSNNSEGKYVTMSEVSNRPGASSQTPVSGVPVESLPSPVGNSPIESLPSPVGNSPIDSLPSPVPNSPIGSLPSPVPNSPIGSLPSPVPNSPIGSVASPTTNALIDSLPTPVGNSPIDSLPSPITNSPGRSAQEPIIIEEFAPPVFYRQEYTQSLDLIRNRVRSPSPEPCGPARLSKLNHINELGQKTGFLTISNINHDGSRCTVLYHTRISEQLLRENRVALEQLWKLFPNPQREGSGALDPYILGGRIMHDVHANSQTFKDWPFKCNQKKTAEMSAFFDSTKPKGHYQPWASDIAAKLREFRHERGRGDIRPVLDMESSIFLTTFLNSVPIDGKIQGPGCKIEGGVTEKLENI